MAAEDCGNSRRDAISPVWVSEAGASSFGADEVQTFGLKRTAELLLGEVERVHWYSLHDLPASWTATTRHKEAEGSAYYRHYYMGLLREDGSAKPATENFPSGMGVCQWFHYEDHRLDSSIEWLRRLGVRHLRHRCQLGRLVPGGFGEVVRPSNECAGPICRDHDALLHARAPGYRAPLRQPAKDAQDFADFATWAVRTLCAGCPETVNQN